MSEQVTMEVPIALQQLIKTNNDLLRIQQSRLVKEIEEANAQMMSILGLNPAAGWRLDMERMVYVRIDLPTEETPETPAEA